MNTVTSSTRTKNFDQSANIILWTHRDLTKEIVSPKKIILDPIQKNSRANNHKQSIQLEETLIPLIKLTTLISKIRKWKNGSITITTIGEQVRKWWISSTRERKVRLVNRKAAGNHKPKNFRFKFDSNLNRKVWVPRLLDKPWRDEGAAIDQEVLFRNTEKNRWGGGYFVFNEPKVSSSTAQNKKEPGPVSSKHRREWGGKNFVQFSHRGPQRLWYRRKHDTLYSSQPCDWKTENEERRSRRKFEESRVQLDDWPKNFDTQNIGWSEITTIKDRFWKLSERAREDFSPVFSEITERFGLLFAGDRIVVPEKLKKQVVDALHFGHPGSTKMPAESNIFWWSGMNENIENKCSTCNPKTTDTTRTSSG